MKSIVVKSKNKVAIYTSGWRWKYNEDGTTEEIKETDEEIEQHCYDQLIKSTRREEFDRTMKALILGYLDWKEEECEDIKIVVEGKNRHCEMNMTVTFDWSKAAIIELPPIEPQSP